MCMHRSNSQQILWCNNRTGRRQDSNLQDNTQQNATVTLNSDYPSTLTDSITNIITVTTEITAQGNNSSYVAGNT